MSNRSGGKHNGVARRPVRSTTILIPESRRVVLSGSFRKDPEGLRRVFEDLQARGCQILSPQSVESARQIEGFVFMRGEEFQAPSEIERQHLEAIKSAELVWLFVPNSYLGLSAAFEIGFAHAMGVPVFCDTELSDPVLNPFVTVVSSLGDALALAPGMLLRPLRAPNPHAVLKDRLTTYDATRVR